jgi:uncharacterized protein YndB with AHSA1/START domain
MSGPIRVSREYEGTREELWELIATSEGLAAWLMPNDFRPEVGHRFTFTDKPRPPVYDGIVGCEVLEIEPFERLRVSWCGGPVDTEVTFTLSEPAPGRVRLDLEQSGFEGLRAAVVRVVLDLGWRDLLRRRLPRHIADRREQRGDP